MRPNIDSNDYNIKMRKIHEFLSDGDKVKVTLRFRGRELAHQDLAMNLLERVRDELGDQAKVEQFPKMEGRQMVMIMAPPQVARIPRHPVTTASSGDLVSELTRLLTAAGVLRSVEEIRELIRGVIAAPPAPIRTPGWISSRPPRRTSCAPVCCG